MMRVGVVPGTGAVVRRDDTVVVIGSSPAPSDGLPGALIDAVTEHDGPERIRHLARLVLAEPEEVSVAVATIEDGEASILLFGDLDLDSPAGRVSGAGHVLGVTETVPLAGGLAIVAAGAEVPELAPWNHLERGSVRGDGVVIVAADEPPSAAGGHADGGRVPADEPPGAPPPPPPPSAPAADDQGHGAPSGEHDEPAGAEPAADEPPGGDDEDDPTGPMPVTGAESPAQEPAEAAAQPPAGQPPAAPAPPPDHDSFTSVRLTPDADLSERQPLPIAGRPEPSTAVAGPLYEQPVEVVGVYSPRGFFNHPDAKYCSRTGVKMGASQTKVLTRGPRPPLGVITLDDGATLTVRWNTVIGRDPHLDERVQREEAAPFVVTDIAQSVSRRHALLELVDWDVLISDLGSRNKTWIQEGPDGERRPLASGERTVLRSGMTVHLGDRSFVFNEHHVR